MNQVETITVSHSSLPSPIFPNTIQLAKLSQMIARVKYKLHRFPSPRVRKEERERERKKKEICSTRDSNKPRYRGATMQIHNNPADSNRNEQRNSSSIPPFLSLSLSLSPRRVLISPHGAFKTKYPLETRGRIHRFYGKFTYDFYGTSVFSYSRRIRLKGSLFCSRGRGGRSKFPGKLVSSVRRGSRWRRIIRRWRNGGGEGREREKKKKAKNIMHAL